MKNNKKILLVTSLTIAVLLIGYFQSGSGISIVKPEMNNEFQPLLASNEIAFEKATSAHLYVVESFNKPIPKSLEDIDLNIELPLDADGNLIVGMEVKDLFEIYLSAMGEEKLDDILLRIQSALAQQLTAPALGQGYDALKRFIDYKVELANLEKQTVDPTLSELENIRRQKEILATIQQEYFSPTEADALFTVEAQYDDFMLEHLTIQQNENLTVEEKQQQVQALEASLPEDVRAGRESAMAQAKVYEQARLMKAEGQSDAEIYQMRSETLGEEAATALAQLDAERSQWQQRLDSFKSQYESIEASGLSNEDQQAEVNALLARDFNSTESIRVRALTGVD